MLGRITGIVCLAATLASVSLVGSAQAQSMDMMSAVMMSNRFINPVSQYQPISYTSETAAKATHNKTASRAAAEQPDRAVVKANSQTQSADASLRPVRVSDPR